MRAAAVPERALVLYVVYLALAFGLRSILQRRRTGSAGFHGVSGRPGSAEWAGGVLFVVALLLGLAAPILDLTGVLGPVPALDGAVGHVTGLVLAAGGVVTTLASQVTMGTSWRIGVDAEERTELVTSGPFALVRNPFFSGTGLVAGGLVLMVPSAVAIVALFALFAAVELQVRVVEEPYLLEAQGADYREYAARVGRFVPGVGRLTSSGSAGSLCDR